ncbi:electron transfer flavoprotein subunit beta [Rhodovastum atsumiense]|uniref:Electron transfer flavoprotein subunit beta n=2 Tax=Rhodovastum atsumiense TaxID=504468 RepID=A0A5M6J114_9PROT|nr:electron transfer flavoprotein subunit beta [Rhodovastum atsumiense]
MVLPFPGTATVLLSAGRHPVSGRAAAVAVEAQATRLARMLGATVSGLHAGAEDAALREHLGMGLDRIDVPKVAAEADPLPVLASWLRAEAPALILAGRRGLGGADAGLLPYRLAQALGLPLVADVAALRLLPSGDLLATQALPRGARRDVRVRLPAVVTVHPAAPAPWPFAYARARRGRCVPLPSPGVGLPGGLPSLALEERPYRPRPRLLQAGPEQSGTVRGRVLINPAPAEAAREILAHLRAIGVLRPDS